MTGFAGSVETSRTGARSRSTSQAASTSPRARPAARVRSTSSISPSAQAVGRKDPVRAWMRVTSPPSSSIATAQSGARSCTTRESAAAVAGSGVLCPKRMTEASPAPSTSSSQVGSVVPVKGAMSTPSASASQDGAGPGVVLKGAGLAMPQPVTSRPVMSRSHPLASRRATSVLQQLPQRLGVERRLVRVEVDDGQRAVAEVRDGQALPAAVHRLVRDDAGEGVAGGLPGVDDRLVVVGDSAREVVDEEVVGALVTVGQALELLGQAGLVMGAGGAGHESVTQGGRDVGEPRIVQAHGRAGADQLGHLEHVLLVVPVGDVDGLLEARVLAEEAEAALALVRGVAHTAQLVGAEGAAVVHLEQREGVGDVVAEHRDVLVEDAVAASVRAADRGDGDGVALADHAQDPADGVGGVEHGRVGGGGLPLLAAGVLVGVVEAEVHVVDVVAL